MAVAKDFPEDWPEGDPGDEIEIGYEGDDEDDYFARIMYYVLDFPGLGRRGKDAYVCLVRCLGWGKRKQGVTREQLAAVMSISTDTLDRGLKELETKGLIETIRQRDPLTGNWKTSSYLLKDTKSARMRARIVELEQALGKAAGKTKAKPQVNTTPQNAARAEEDNPGTDGGDQSADCGVDATCDDAASPQVGTSPQNAAPPVRNLRNRRSADCGHRRDSLFEEREETREEDEPPPPQPPATADEQLAEGEGEEDSDLETLIREVLAIRPGWGPSSIRRALQHPDVVERPWPVVRRAMLSVASDPATQAPGRLAADGPWWNLPTLHDRPTPGPPPAQQAIAAAQPDREGKTSSEEGMRSAVAMARAGMARRGRKVR